MVRTCSVFTVMVAVVTAVAGFLPPATGGTPPPRRAADLAGTAIDLKTTSCQATAFDGKYLWVSAFGTVKAVYKIDGRNKVAGRINFGSDFPGGLVFDGRHLWVQSGGNKGFFLNVIDPKTTRIIARLRYADRTQRAGGAAVGFDGSRVWVSVADKVMCVDPKSRAITYSIPLPQGSYVKGMAFDGSCLWLMDTGNSRIFKVDLAARRVVATLPVRTSPRMNGIAFDGSQVWVAGRGGILAYRIDPRRAAVTAEVRGANGAGAAFDGRSVWVNEATGFGIARIDPVTAQITASYSVPVWVYNVAFAGGYLWMVTDGGVYKVVPPR